MLTREGGHSNDKAQSWRVKPWREHPPPAWHVENSYHGPMRETTLTIAKNIHTRVSCWDAANTAMNTHGRCACNGVRLCPLTRDHPLPSKMLQAALDVTCSGRRVAG